MSKALDLEIKGKKYVLYQEIMEEDEQGNQGKFCETLRMQVSVHEACVHEFMICKWRYLLHNVIISCNLM